MANELRPIRTAEEHESALEEIDRLWNAPEGSPEADRLDVLATLVDAYEERQFPFDPPDPIDAIEFRMAQMGYSRKDLEPLIGSRARVAEILNRKRGLSLEMIRRLHDAWGIPAEILIRPTRGREAA